MKKSLPCLSALATIILAMAAIAEPSSELPANSSQVPVHTPADPQADKTPVGNKLLVQAVTQLERRASINAQLNYKVSLNGQENDGIVRYWQQGSGEELKVRLELQVVGKDAQLLQVCNSRFVWIDRKLPSGRTVTRLDLRQLRADPSLGTANLDDIKSGEANWSALQSELTAYTGGLPTLLNALNDNFAFLPPQAVLLPVDPPIVAESTNVPVFAIIGHWKPEKLATLLSKTPANPPDGKQVAAEPKHAPRKTTPERLPEEVMILFRQADLFPCRIEYRRLETPSPSGDESTAIPCRLSAHPLVMLQLAEVVFDAPIAAGQFDYDPGNADWSDQTTAILQRLRQQPQSQVATRPATDGTAPAR